MPVLHGKIQNVLRSLPVVTTLLKLISLLVCANLLLITAVGTRPCDSLPRAQGPPVNMEQ